MQDSNSKNGKLKRSKPKKSQLKKSQLKKSLWTSITTLALVASPALAMNMNPSLATSSSPDSSHTEATDKKNDEWHIDLSDHWRNSVDADDQRVLGYVVSVDYPKFTLRTHDQGVMNFMIPVTSEYADDLRTGNRIQVWYDDADPWQDDEAVWYLVTGYGVNADDAAATWRGNDNDSPKPKSQSAQMSTGDVQTTDPQAVQNTALPPGSMAGPGPNAYTLMGTITEVKEDAIVLDTVVGPRVVRLVEQTATKAELEKGNQIAVEFHRGGPVIHAKVIHEAEDFNQRHNSSR